MLPRKRPWISGQVRKAVKSVARRIERTDVGKLIRKSLIGRTARRVKAATRGITLSQRVFQALVRDIDIKGVTREHIKTIQTMTKKQRKDLLSKILLERRNHIQELLEK